MSIFVLRAVGGSHAATAEEAAATIEDRTATSATRACKPDPLATERLWCPQQRHHLSDILPVTRAAIADPVIQGNVVKTSGEADRPRFPPATQPAQGSIIARSQALLPTQIAEIDGVEVVERRRKAAASPGA
jgi:hypothetical protein